MIMRKKEDWQSDVFCKKVVKRNRHRLKNKIPKIWPKLHYIKNAKCCYEVKISVVQCDMCCH